MHTLISAIGWNPELRGITTVMIAVGVLIGFTYLIIATNTGPRLGFLITFAALFGWMTIMGTTWWIYGLGLKGREPQWKVKNIVNGPIANSTIEQAHDLTKWRSLTIENGIRLEAQNAADAEMVKLKVFETTADFTSLNGYIYGGEPFARPAIPYLVPKFFHKPLYAVIQVQANKKFEVPFGQPPHKAEVDASQPVVSVVLVRDLGSKRFPSAMITLGSLILFLMSISMLHTRDKRVMLNRSQPLAIDRA